MSTNDNSDVTHALWLIYRNAIKAHIDRDTPRFETEDQYRERAEKAGLVAVANFVGKAYREG